MVTPAASAVLPMRSAAAKLALVMATAPAAAAAAMAALHLPMDFMVFLKSSRIFFCSRAICLAVFLW